VWDLITWWMSLPSSSSHALVGALVGAAVAEAGGRFDAVVWSHGGAHWWLGKGVIPTVVVPMVASPVVGLLIGFLLIGGLYAVLAWFSRQQSWLRLLGRTPFVNSFFSKAQIASTSAMGLAHGMNDAQKSMSLIAVALASATAAGPFDHLPAWLHFLRVGGSAHGGFAMPAWVAVVCALTMAASTAGGGWRIIKTLGHKMVKLNPINGFAAEGSSAIVILAASAFGLPVPTTHVVSAVIMGVGSAKRSNAIKWLVVERMVWVRILTLPVTALIAWGFIGIARLWR
jgi:PiT family inorganic phosphate transporter